MLRNWWRTLLRQGFGDSRRDERRRLKGRSAGRVKSGFRLRLEELEPRVVPTWMGATSGTTNDAAHAYLNTANWAGGTIDDSFSGVTFTANTTLFLNADHTTLAAGLNLNYNGAFDLKIGRAHV